jgi:ABC-2 type transport system permease protein
MSGLLRSDFYRLFKSKSFYICTLVAIFLLNLNLFTIKWASNMSGEMGEIYASLLPKDGITYGIKAFSDGNTQMIFAIIVAIFVVAEFSHGTMKNIISKGFSRTQAYLSKLITMIIATFIIIFAGFLVTTASATVISGAIGSFSWDIIKIIGIELLLNAALISILLLSAMVVRNLGGVIAINIIGILSFGPLIFTLLEYLSDGKVMFTHYSLFYNMALYMGTTAAAGSDYLKSALVAIAYLILTTVIGIFAFKKTDIK